MKFFIGRIDPLLTRRDFKDYFDRYGIVLEIKLFERDRYGFVTFEEPFSPDRLLSNKEHSIDDRVFIVERSKEQSRYGGRSDNYDRYERDGYDYDRDGCGRDRFRRDGYGYERDRFVRDGSRDGSLGRKRCEHCDRCPVHGTLAVRDGHSNGNFKMVCEKIDVDVQTKDLENFAIENGFNPKFVRALGDCGFLEFEYVTEKDAALKKLDGAVLTLKDEEGRITKSYEIETRSYVPPDQFHRERTFKKRRMNEETTPQAAEEEDPRIQEVYNDSDDKAIEVQEDNL